jgi:hypothetical protein
MPTLHGTITVHGSQKEARNIERAIYMSQRNINSIKSAKSNEPEPPDMPKGKTDLKDQEETKLVPLENAVLDRKVTIGGNLSKEEAELIETLAKNKDVFAWSASDLKGVSKNIIQHTHDINPKIKPRKQRQRKMSKDRVLAVKAKVQRLLDANVIREVKYSEWIANVVLVPKKNEKMRMCIGFTDLNKACKKDPFPLPRIDTSVDKAVGCKRFFTPRLFLRSGSARKMRKNKFYYSFWNILLHQNAQRTKERGINLRMTKVVLGP